MEYFDEKLLEEKRDIERKKHTTLETGIYAGEELVKFKSITLPESKIHISLPERFVIMPEIVKNVKYPSKYAPSFIMTSLDTMVNFAFNLLDVKDGNTNAMSNQFQRALQNMNPSIIIKNQADMNTTQGNEMSWFEYHGFLLDGQSYNRVFLIKMRNCIIHCTFVCQLRDRENWNTIIDKVFMAIEEDT